METKSIQQFMNSYSVKMILVSFLAIVLLIPSFMIQEVIHERMDLHDKVKKELHEQWGGATGAGRPCVECSVYTERCQ